MLNIIKIEQMYNFAYLKIPQQSVSSVKNHQAVYVYVYMYMYMYMYMYDRPSFFDDD